MSVDRLLNMSDVWATWIAAVTWQLAVLAAAAWVVERVLRLRQPGARYGLWWFVLVAPLALAPIRMGLDQRQAVVRVAPPAVVDQAVTRVRMPVVTPVERAAPHSIAPMPEVKWWSGVDAAGVLGLMWALGCLLLIARLVVGHARARLLVGESTAVTDERVLGALSELLAEAGVKREVGLRVSSSVGAPVLYGMRRPAILLPEGWVEGLAPDDLRGLLAHEVAHVKRGDCLANLIQRICEIPAFFHPGVWLASRKLGLAREELADGWALGRGVDAGRYARSLAEAAERTQARLGAMSVGVAEGKSTLLRRVDAIMGGGNVARVSLRLSLALLVAGALTATGLAMVRVVSEGQQRQESSGARVEVVTPDAELSPGELTSLLREAGLTYERFRYEFAREHQLRFTFDEYVDGTKLVRGGTSEDSLGMPAGQSSVLLVVRREGQKLGFSFDSRGGSGGALRWDLDGYTSYTQGMLRGFELAPGGRAPVYVFACNREETGGIGGFGSHDSLEDIVSRYDRAIVVLAEIVVQDGFEGKPGDGVVEQDALLEQIRAGASERYHAVTSCRGSVRLVATRPVSEGADREKVLWEKVLRAVFDGKRLRMSGKAVPGTAGDYEGAFDGEKTTAWIDFGTGADVMARIESGLSGFTAGDFSLDVDPRYVGSHPWLRIEPDGDANMRVVGRDTWDGDACVIVEVTISVPESAEGAYVRSRIWVNLDKGCAVPKYLVWYAPSKEAEEGLMQDEAVEFRQYGNGFWGPASYTRFVYEPPGTLEKKVDGTYEPGFEINTAISEDELELTLPSGMEVWDDRTKTSYTVP